ncbi:MAG: glycoside hydrolase family 104 protein [Pseudorhodobacter sp.]|nr:glycoside hydrolase family 104 protein [Pseudorhodobacter sp.]
MTKNLSAFLSMIARSEGTMIPNSDNGYLTIVGGTLMETYKDHPRKLVKLNARLSSTAAGRYQILARYFDHYKKQLHLPDFSPLSQDMIAIQLIRECRALDDIENGDLISAIKKCASRWASLPGNAYGQRQVPIEALKLAYAEAGGTIA